MKVLIFLLAIFSPSLSLRFECTFQMRTFETTGTHYTCDFPRVTDMDEGTWLQGVSGTHQSGKSNSHVKALAIREFPCLTYIPSGIRNYFPNIVAILFFKTNLLSISSSSLNTFGSNLLYFGISFNHNLETLPAGLFSQTSNLKDLVIFDNNIKHVGSGLLNGLSNLKNAYFGYNYCISYNATSSTQLSSLRTNLANNCRMPTTTTSTTLRPTTTRTTTRPATTRTTTRPTTTSLTTRSTTPGPSCDINDICDLQEQNELLIEKNAELELNIEETNTKLDQVLDNILELSLRPCGIQN